MTIKQREYMKLIMVAVVVIGVMGVYQISQLREKTTKISSKIDARFKSYDAFLWFDYVQHGKNGKICINRTHEQIKAYYAQEGYSETPFAKKLLSEDYACDKQK